MTIIQFPRPDVNMETAEMVLYSDPALFTDEEVETAAQYVLTHNRDWPTVETARKALSAIHKRRREADAQADEARKALANVYPELWPGLVIIGCAFGVALGFALLVMP